jgi:spermidine/putrescine transport system ATP-binding protein
MSSPVVQVENLTKEYGSVVAVDDVSFQIEDGEFFSLLGPSGCGKTTTLRSIAGFEKPTAGTIHIQDEVVNDIPPYHRDVGMVFQNYALFPHKTVGENVGFGLKMDGISTAERRSKVADILSLVDLDGFQDRAPGELSGGQQQRVALARALVIEPNVLLLDEPLSNLDLKLRSQMQFELKRIQEEVGITTVYVTHDQEEAMTMSDKILVMNGGQSEQLDTPKSIYNNPSNTFVADFIGESNFLGVEVISHTDEQARVTLKSDGNKEISLYESELRVADVGVGQTAVLSLRPENLSLASRETNSDRYLSGSISSKTFQGKRTTFIVNVGDEQVRVELPGKRGQTGFEEGERVAINWDEGDCLLLNSLAE